MGLYFRNNSDGNLGATSTGGSGSKSMTYSLGNAGVQLGPDEPGYYSFYNTFQQNQPMTVRDLETYFSGRGAAQAVGMAAAGSTSTATVNAGNLNGPAAALGGGADAQNLSQTGSDAAANGVTGGGGGVVNGTVPGGSADGSGWAHNLPLTAPKDAASIMSSILTANNTPYHPSTPEDLAYPNSSHATFSERSFEFSYQRNLSVAVVQSLLAAQWHVSEITQNRLKSVENQRKLEQDCREGLMSLYLGYCKPLTRSERPLHLLFLSLEYVIPVLFRFRHELFASFADVSKAARARQQQQVQGVNGNFDNMQPWQQMVLSLQNQPSMAAKPSNLILKARPENAAFTTTPHKQFNNRRASDEAESKIIVLKKLLFYTISFRIRSVFLLFSKKIFITFKGIFPQQQGLLHLLVMILVVQKSMKFSQNMMVRELKIVHWVFFPDKIVLHKF